MLRTVVCIGFWCSLSLIAQPPQTESDTRPTLVVVGFACQVDDANWRDARVGFGVRSLLAQALFDTGRFANLEEKAEIRDEIRHRAETMWLHAEDKVDFVQASEDLGTWGADFAAYGRVTYFGRPQTRVSMGPLHSRTRTTIIKLEVTLIDVGSKKSIEETGVGRAKTRAKSALFTFRRDQVLWDETTVGIATGEAIRDAVAELMKTFDKKW